MTTSLRNGGLGLVALAATLGACGDGPGFNFLDGDTIAVTVGDFDNVQETFNRANVDTVRYDGLISTATWVEDAEDFTPPQLNVEGLFLSERNAELRKHKIVVLASGTRGFGLREYNSLQPDDAFVGDEVAMSNIESYVRSGGILVATDWSYDVVPRTLPDVIDFLGDETVLDDAQRGDIGRVQATVVDDELREALQTDQLSLTYNFSNWSVIEDVDESNARVLLRGDVTYREGEGGGTRTIEDAPLLVSINAGGEFGGQLLYSTFHLDAQNEAVVDTMLKTLIGDFSLETTVRDPGGAQ